MTNTQIILKDIIEQEYLENKDSYKSSEDFFEFFQLEMFSKIIL